MTPPLFQVEGLRVSYPGRGRSRTKVAVDSVSFRIERGRCYGLVGASGCGKSSTALAIATLLQPSGGTLLWDGKAASAQQTRDRIGVVFQDPYGALDPRWTVGASIAEPLEIKRIGTRGERRETVLRLLAEVGLPSSMGERYPHELSGGQRQRVVIARALAPEPQLLILDEPTSALDVSIQAQMINLLKELQDRRKVAYLFISHDLGVVRALAHRVGVMAEGRIVEERDCDDLFRDPRHPQTLELLAAVPEIPFVETAP